MESFKNLFTIFITVLFVVELRPMVPPENLLDKAKGPSLLNVDFALNLKGGEVKVNLTLPKIFGLEIDRPAQIPFLGKYIASGDIGYIFNDPLVIIENKPEMIEKAPKILIDNIINEIDKKLSKDTKINFYTLIYGKLNPILLGLADEAAIKLINTRIRNVGFHPSLAEWQKEINADVLNKIKKDELIKKRSDIALIGSRADELYIPIKMGLFDANGVIPQPKFKEEGWVEGISFNKFDYQPVDIHKNGALAFSPDSAQFKLENNRNLATFWTAAISPNKKNVNVTYIILIDDEEIQNKIEASAKKAANLRQLIKDLRSFKLANDKDDKALSDALNKIDLIVEAKIVAPLPVLPPSPPVLVTPTPVAATKIENLFSDKEFNKLIKLPNLIDANIKDNIYQIESEKKDIANSAINAFKNGIFGLMALNSYNVTPDSFIASINSIQGSTPDSQCLIKKIESLTKEKKEIDENDLKLIINNIDKFIKDCDLIPIDKNKFDIVENYAFAIRPEHHKFPLKLYQDLEKSLKSDSDFQHILIYKVKKNDWLTIIIYKMQHEPLKILIIDSQNRKDFLNEPETKALLDGILNPSVVLSKRKIEQKLENSIFGNNGYIQKITEYQNEKKQNTKNSLNNAKIILKELLNNPIIINDIKFLTPVRAYFALNKLYPEDQIYLDEKNKDFAPTYFNLKINEIIDNF